MIAGLAMPKTNASALACRQWEKWEWESFAEHWVHLWNNNPSDLRSAYRNNNTPDNRNNNIGFRCVWVEVSSPKTEHSGETVGGYGLPGQSQESSLTVAPRPCAEREKTRRQAVAGNSAPAGWTSRSAIHIPLNEPSRRNARQINRSETISLFGGPPRARRL
jgi:hypothetical protein